MWRFVVTLTLLLILLTYSGFAETESLESPSIYLNISNQDTTIDKQILYIGRVWRNLHNRVLGDQFLFSHEFLQGSVTINGREFKNLQVRYDIFSDEIMTITENGMVVQLNKEMVDRFTITYQNIIHRFINLKSDSVNKISGYADIIYNGKTILYFKYKKEIKTPDIAQMQESFYQTREVYIFKDKVIHQIKRRRDFVRLLIDKKAQIKKFIKSYSLYGLMKTPEIIVPVLKYYDSLSL